MTPNGQQFVPSSKDWLYTGDSACLVYNQHEWDTGGGDGGLTTAERQRLKDAGA